MGYSNTFSSAMGFCNTKRQTLINDYLRPFVSAIYRNFIYFFYLRILIQDVWRLKYWKLISSTPLIEIRFYRVWYCFRRSIEHTTLGRSSARKKYSKHDFFIPFHLKCISISSIQIPYSSLSIGVVELLRVSWYQKSRRFYRNLPRSLSSWYL